MKKKYLFLSLIIVSFCVSADTQNQPKQQPIIIYNQQQNNDEEQRAKDLLRVLFGQILPSILTVGTGKGNPDQQSTGIVMLTQALGNFFERITRNPELAKFFSKKNEAEAKRFVKSFMQTILKESESHTIS